MPTMDYDYIYDYHDEDAEYEYTDSGAAHHDIDDALDSFGSFFFAQPPSQG